MYTSVYDEFKYTHNDVVFHYSIQSGGSEPYPCHLSVVKRYLSLYPERCRTYVDVGAHIGTTVMPYSRLFTSVVGYEPLEESFNYLKQNVLQNNVSNIQIHHKGLYNKACRGSMVLHGPNSGCFRFEENTNGPVVCSRLDDEELTDVDFLKIDTEGTELFVLQGGLQTILKYKPLIQVEHNSLSDKFYNVSRQQLLKPLLEIGYTIFDDSDPGNVFLIFKPNSLIQNVIYCFWTGPTQMSELREYALKTMEQITQCRVICVTPNTLSTFILHDHPLHQAYEYLSETHRSDYLRTYFMHFYGGGYADIKIQGGSWVESFDQFRKSDAYICGYPEYGPDDVAGEDDVREKWQLIVGNGCYICRPNSPFTQAWYSRMIALLDEKLPELREHPAKYPRDCKEDVNGYPIGWNEMLGRIFHRVCTEHTDRILQTLPRYIDFKTNRY